MNEKRNQDQSMLLSTALRFDKLLNILITEYEKATKNDTLLSFESIYQQVRVKLLSNLDMSNISRLYKEINELLSLSITIKPRNSSAFILNHLMKNNFFKYTQIALALKKVSYTIECVCVDHIINSLSAQTNLPQGMKQLQEYIMMNKNTPPTVSSIHQIIRRREGVHAYMFIPFAPKRDSRTQKIYQNLLDARSLAEIALIIDENYGAIPISNNFKSARK